VVDINIDGTQIEAVITDDQFQEMCQPLADRLLVPLERMFMATGVRQAISACDS
jgi:molecular chaperone DnaK (HSP70)